MINKPDNPAPPALIPLLALAVPLAIESLRHKSFPEIALIAKEAGQYIAEHGDVILYKGTKKGESAKAFAMLAKGLAALAFAPGGVTFYDLHWDAADYP